MGAKPYPAYKDSGVEWIGEIPEHWEVKRFQFIVKSSNAGEVIDKSYWYGGGEVLFTCQIDPIVCEYSDFPPWKRTTKDDVLVTRNATPYVHLPPVGSIYSNVVQRCTLHGFVNKAYLHRILLASSGALQQEGYGVSIPSFSYGKWRNLLLTFPPLEEQKQIASFLDRETSKIDTLIDKQQLLINLLKEKRGSLISHTVTKGLNPNAPMKDSGVEWIGDIPEHWVVKRLKDVADCRLSNVDKHTVDGEAAVVLCNYVDVYKNDFITSDISFMPATATPNQISKLSINVDDVLITKDSESPDDIGVPALVRSVVSRLVCGYHLALIRTASHTQDGGYMFRFLTSKSATSQFYTMAKGITRYAIGKGEISRLLLPSPPLEEQKQIAAFLDRETSKIDTLIEKANQSIALLKERRSSLISAAVTGKIDVREAA